MKVDQRKGGGIIFFLMVYVLMSMVPNTSKAQNIIYNGMSFIDPEILGFDISQYGIVGGFALGTQFTGKTTITELENNKYNLRITMQRDVVIDYTLIFPKIINESKIQFTIDNKNRGIVTVTPEVMYVEDLKVTLISSSEFSNLLKALRKTFPSVKKQGTSGKKSTDKSSQQPQTKKTKTYQADPLLIKYLMGPMGYFPEDPTTANLQQWRDALNKTGTKFNERVLIGSIWLDSDGTPVTILGSPMRYSLSLNLKEFTIGYSTNNIDLQSAAKFYTDLLQTLKASGVNISECKPSDSFPYRAEGEIGKYKVTVSVLEVYNGNNYAVVLNSEFKRDYRTSDYEIKMEASESPGCNVFGIPLLKLSSPMEQLAEQFKLTLNSGEIGNNYIKTYSGNTTRTIFIPLGGIDKCRGLKSGYFHLYDRDNYRIYELSMKPWLNEGVKSNNLEYGEEEKIYDQLFNNLIGKLKSEGITIKKGSANDLKPYGWQIKTKECWLVDNGEYKDYYILTKDKYNKNIYIFSIFKK